MRRASAWASNLLYSIPEPLRFDLSSKEHAPLISRGNYSGVISLNANSLQRYKYHNYSNGFIMLQVDSYYYQRDAYNSARQFYKDDPVRSLRVFRNKHLHKTLDYRDNWELTSYEIVVEEAKVV
jgi:hypothetical protein